MFKAAQGAGHISKVFAAHVEFERDMIVERTRAGFAAVERIETDMANTVSLTLREQLQFLFRYPTPYRLLRGSSFVKSETVELEGVARILFERSSRAKNINISVRPFTGVRVAVPFGVSFKRAGEFVCSKKGWIQKHLARMRQVEQDYRILSQNFKNISRTDGRKILVQRLDELADKYGFKYNRIFVRNQKTRWGSCSSKNNISLNIKLVKLPERLMDYIILHELVHTRIRNHGKEFYAELGRLVADQKLLDSELKEYGAGLL